MTCNNSNPTAAEKGEITPTLLVDKLQNQPPAFQFYVDDFIGGTRDLPPHDVGCFINLLCHQWNRGSIPLDDSAKLQRIAGGKVSADVLEKFPGSKNVRLELERKKQSDYREEQRKKGVASGVARAAAAAAAAEQRFNHGSTTVQPSMEPKGNPTTTTSTPLGVDSKTIRQGRVVWNGKLNPEQTDVAARFESALGEQWDQRNGCKWMKRIKSEPAKSNRCIADLEDAIKLGQIGTTPAQYVENNWKEFFT